MAFDNTNFRQCSYNYNNTVGNSGATTDDSQYFSTVSKDIGNTGGAESCIQIELTPVQTVFKENVSITQQIEVFFQAEKNYAGTDILSIYPVEQRQGLFRLPQTGTDGVIVYIAEQSGNDTKYYAYLSVAQITNLQKDTKPDGSVLRNYSGTAESLNFPAPLVTDEYTIKRLTHSVTDFVTYQPGGQLTSNLLNFQKGQEMFLIQELLWSIEMDMITFSDLSGNGKIVTTGADGNIPVEDINLSIFDLNDVNADGSQARSVLYREAGTSFSTQSVESLINLSDVINVSTNTPVSNNVLTWNSTDNEWQPKSVSEAAGSCTGILAATLNFCSGSHTGVNLTDIFITGDTFSAIDTKLMTAGGLTTVPLNTLKNINETGIADGYLLKYQASDQTYIPINPSTLGTAGDVGGNTFDYAFTTSATPSSGQLYFNGSLSATTQINVNNTNADGADVTNWFTSFSVGSNDFVKVFKKGAPVNFAVFKLTGVALSSTSVTALTVEHVLSNGTISNTDAVYLTHIPSGTTGAAGADGAQGDTGAAGDTGPAGARISSGTVTQGTDLVFNFVDTDTNNFDVTLSNWLTIVDATWYYVTAAVVNNYGTYTYSLATTPGGTASITNAVNLAESGNSGTNDTSQRTFQGIVYNAPTAFTITAPENEKVYGVNLVSNDLIKLLPIAVGTGVMVKDTNKFSTQNVTELKACAS